MNDEELRLIFARFQNLNLLCLMEDLKRGHVHRLGWMGRFMNEGLTLCPLAHGWSHHVPVGWASGGPTLNFMSRLLACEEYKAAGFGPEEVALVAMFLNWWDWLEEKETRSSKAARLGRALEHIWRERLEDAEAVQAVLEPVEEGVLA